MADSDSGCVSAVADDNARTTDDLSIPPFLDRTNDAPTQTQLAEAKPTISAQVLTLVRRVKALIEKGDRAAEKAEQFYKSAGIHIKEIKEQSEDWETIVREKCGIGRSRAYELMAIADGRTTLEKVRASTNERQKIHKAKSQSVTKRTESELAPTRAAGGGAENARLDDDDPDDAPIEEGINKKNPRVAYLLRADQAKRFAAYSGPVDREIVDYARAVATAWSNLARELEQKLAATNAGVQ
jgi:hypothetical protein